MSEEITEGLGRRDVLKRGAMVGGALIWTVPAVQTLAGPAFAASSPAGQPCVETTCSRVTFGGVDVFLSCNPAPTFEGCLCRCAGDPSSPCISPTPCTVPQVCIIVPSCSV